MAQRTKVDLSPEQRAELKRAERRHPKPYIREYASGILKSQRASPSKSPGMACLVRAAQRQSQSGSSATKTTAWPVCWFGQAAGASPLFSPQHVTDEATRAELDEAIHRSPRLDGLPRIFWLGVNLAFSPPPYR